jgi:hypothetical protein
MWAFDNILVYVCASKRKDDPDSPNLYQALHGEHAKQYMEVMKKRIMWNTHIYPYYNLLGGSASAVFIICALSIKLPYL